ncbi:hypothetical protein PXK30_09400 [Phaeobacter gallaeciensis]|uniref:hypothetical protein n=2 Tax=Phaeobacter gallaeciensis TaxID=60890 RepID=UPI00237F8C1C|nr:hypothetical protein [Phaeobacter gallaeciensis]MDE4303663.1 hypothetical protein [Phaeobacter gallaeciensis]MDE4307856.1 hypothetical protein [Phaeobacter gallaeciensis]MDE4312314.1 hypothetical protein [Phaeobacter gallaeciensis]MDE4316785.1 hypothetical protein [Phaeobacter gallaeciensis]MDE4321248.1 hypothetical protein [Phaeobacter gallaeciensis]
MASTSQLQRDMFAEYVAEGMHPTDAYEKAGFVRNRSSASRMTKRPDVAAKIAELRAERRAARQANLPAPLPVPEALPLVPTCDDPQTVAEMGFNKVWLANAYQRIAAAAEDVGQFSASITALGRIQNLVEAEQKTEPERAPDAPRIDINSIADVLGKVADIIEVSKAPDRSTANAVTHSEQKALTAAENET